MTLLQIEALNTATQNQITIIKSQNLMKRMLNQAWIPEHMKEHFLTDNINVLLREL